MTVCGWHVRISLRIRVARILWNFDFLRGLTPGRLDRFSIGRYEKNREPFAISDQRILPSSASRVFTGISERFVALELDSTTKHCT